MDRCAETEWLTTTVFVKERAIKGRTVQKILTNAPFQTVVFMENVPIQSVDTNATVKQVGFMRRDSYDSL